MDKKHIGKQVDILHVATADQSLRFFRRGRASKPKPDLDDEAPSDFEEMDSDVENVDELRGWLSTQGCKTLNLLPKEPLIRKYLPPGNVMELFEHYKSTQKLLGGHCVAYLNFSTTFLVFWLIIFYVYNWFTDYIWRFSVTYVNLPESTNFWWSGDSWLHRYGVDGSKLMLLEPGMVHLMMSTSDDGRRFCSSDRRVFSPPVMSVLSWKPS